MERPLANTQGALSDWAQAMQQWSQQPISAVSQVTTPHQQTEQQRPQEMAEEWADGEGGGDAEYPLLGAPPMGPECALPPDFASVHGLTSTYVLTTSVAPRLWPKGMSLGFTHLKELRLLPKDKKDRPEVIPIPILRVVVDGNIVDSQEQSDPRERPNTQLSYSKTTYYLRGFSRGVKAALASCALLPLRAVVSDVPGSATTALHMLVIYATQSLTAPGPAVPAQPMPGTQQHHHAGHQHSGSSHALTQPSSMSSLSALGNAGVGGPGGWASTPGLAAAAAAAATGVTDTESAAVGALAQLRNHAAGLAAPSGQEALGRNQAYGAPANGAAEGAVVSSLRVGQGQVYTGIDQPVAMDTGGGPSVNVPGQLVLPLGAAPMAAPTGLTGHGGQAPPGYRPDDNPMSAAATPSTTGGPGSSNAVTNLQMLLSSAGSVVGPHQAMLPSGRSSVGSTVWLPQATAAGTQGPGGGQFQSAMVFEWSGSASHSPTIGQMQQRQLHSFSALQLMQQQQQQQQNQATILATNLGSVGSAPAGTLSLPAVGSSTAAAPTTYIPVAIQNPQGGPPTYHLLPAHAVTVPQQQQQQLAMLQPQPQQQQQQHPPQPQLKPSILATLAAMREPEPNPSARAPVFGVQSNTSLAQHQQQTNTSNGLSAGAVHPQVPQLGPPVSNEGAPHGMQHVQLSTAPPTSSGPVHLPPIDLISASDPSAALAPHQRQQLTRALLTAIQAVFGSNTPQLLVASSRLTQLQPAAMVEFLGANYEVLRMALALLPDPGMCQMARRLLSTLLGMDMPAQQ